MARINISNERLAIPQIDEKFCTEALIKLVDLDRDWILEGEGVSLYIRPFIIATEAQLGVKASDEYQFIIICSPSGMYYSEGLEPVKILVEDQFVRAVKGGMGFAKTMGNYAASIKAQVLAHDKGYSQVLWLDGVEHKYVDEVGSMNVFFILGDEVVTPELGGSILSGITRMSVIELLRSWGVKVTERKIAMQELYEASQRGELKEAFGTGTAAVISPMGELYWEGKVMTVNDNKIGAITQRLYDTLTGIQKGELPDTFGWTVEI